MAPFGRAISTLSCILELQGILFERNTAARQGRTIYSDDFFIHIMSCDFRNNTATFSGAVAIFGTPSDILAHDPLSLLTYPMITHTPLVACNLPIKTMVARQ